MKGYGSSDDVRDIAIGLMILVAICTVVSLSFDAANVATKANEHIAVACIQAGGVPQSGTCHWSKP